MSMDDTDKNNPLNILYYENRELELLKNAINIEAKNEENVLLKIP